LTSIAPFAKSSRTTDPENLSRNNFGDDLHGTIILEIDVAKIAWLDGCRVHGQHDDI
jgi:hypothetical protein